MLSVKVKSLAHWATKDFTAEEQENFNSSKAGPVLARGNDKVLLVYNCSAIHCSKSKGWDRDRTASLVIDTNFSINYSFWSTGLTQCSKEAQPQQQDIHLGLDDPKVFSSLVNSVFLWSHTFYTFILHWQAFGWSKSAGNAHPQLPSGLAAPQVRVTLLACAGTWVKRYLCTVALLLWRVRSSMCHLRLSSLIGCSTSFWCWLWVSYTVPEEPHSCQCCWETNLGSVQESNKDHSTWSHPKIPQIQASSIYFCSESSCFQRHILGLHLEDTNEMPSQAYSRGFKAGS